MAGGAGRPARTALRRRVQDEDLPFSERVLAGVELIPPGRVMSYADLSEFVLGHRRSPRRVARVLSQDSAGTGVPWWRVVRADGSSAPEIGHEQQSRLRAEGVPFSGTRVRMEAARWDGC